MSTLQASSHHSETARASRLTSSRPRIIATSVAVALIVNLGLWLAGLVAGGDFTMTNAGEEQTVAPGGAVLFTVVPMTVGLAVAAWLGYLWAGVLRVAQWVGSLAALATIGGTVAATFDAPSTVALAGMHVALIFPLVWGLEGLRRLALARAARG